MCVCGKLTNGQEAPLWSPVTAECCNLLHYTWKWSLAEWCFVADCRKPSGVTLFKCCFLIHVQRKRARVPPMQRLERQKENTWAHCRVHPRLSGGSQEILTLWLRHWQLHPLIAISCISRLSKARLTSLTRSLSLTMLVRMQRTLNLDMCVHEKVCGEFQI